MKKLLLKLKNGKTVHVRLCVYHVIHLREPASVREVVQLIQDSANDNGVLMFTPINSDLK